ncbi:rpoC [Acrasis kona]|uniref:RpoC n=1 Tax=Acrasis kona TaxID=1008807 RepID=A0AAW2ZFI7_9EUKA
MVILETLIVVGGVYAIGCGVAVGVNEARRAYKKKKEKKRLRILEAEKRLDQHTIINPVLQTDQIMAPAVAPSQHEPQLSGYYPSVPLAPPVKAPGRRIQEVELMNTPIISSIPEVNLYSDGVEVNLKSITVKDEAGKTRITSKAATLSECNGVVLSIAIPTKDAKTKLPIPEFKPYTIDAVTSQKKSYKKVVMYYTGHDLQGNYLFTNQ